MKLRRDAKIAPAVSQLRAAMGNDAVRIEQVHEIAALIPELRGAAVIRPLFKNSEAGPRTALAAGETSDLDRIFVLSETSDSALALLSVNPNVEYAQPNFIVKASALPNDEFIDSDQDSVWSKGAWGQSYSDLWGLEAIGAVDAWSVPSCTMNCRGEGIITAVVDTGVATNHPDLAANIWINPAEIAGNGLDDDNNGFRDDVSGWDFDARDNNPYDENGHGTHVAGTIGAVANNGIGIAGVAPGTKILPVRALDANGSGTMENLANGIKYAADMGAKVINNSWGCNFCPSNPVAEDVVRYALARGAINIFAAGNESSDTTDVSPQNMREVITVGAIDYEGYPSFFSNYGAAVDISAPGGGTFEDGVDFSFADILSLRLPGSDIGPAVGTQYSRLQGTSMAAPHASGLVTLILARRTGYSLEDVRSLLKISSFPFSLEPADPAGQGIINAEAAVEYPGKAPIAFLNLPATAFGVLPMEGTAGASPRLSSWTLSRANPENFFQYTQIRTSNTSVENAALAPALDTTSLVENGIYRFKLDVRDNTSRRITELADVRIDNATIDFPREVDIFRAGETIEVQGLFRPSVSQLSGDVKVRGTAAPLAGFQPSAQAPQPGSRGALARWDTSAVSAAPAAAPRFYDITVGGAASGGVVRDSVAAIYLDSQLKPGWPKRFDKSDYVVPGKLYGPDVITADIVSGGKKEIAVLIPGAGNCRSDPPVVMLLDHLGSELWRRTLPGCEADSQFRPSYQLAVGNLDNDPDLEILANSLSDVDGNDSVYQFEHDGALKPGWPIKFGLFISMLIADLDRDGTQEIVIASDESGDRIIHILSGDGKVLKRFPAGDLLLYSTLTGYLGMAVGNFDEDTDLEIAVIQAAAVSYFNADGTSKRVFSLQSLQQFAPTLAVADIDNNGKDDIITMLVNFSPINGDATVSEVFVIGGGSPKRKFLGIVSTQIAVADVEGDGLLEIAVSTHDATYLFDSAGALLPGWPIDVQDLPEGERTRSYGGTLLADVDGDGKLDIVASRFNGSRGIGDIDIDRGGILAWDRFGNFIDLNPSSTLNHNLLFDHALSSPAVVDDIEGDGRIDILAGGGETYYGVSGEYKDKFGHAVFAWEAGQAAAPSSVPWAMYMGGPTRNGHYPPDFKTVLKPTPTPTPPPPPIDNTVEAKKLLKKLLKSVGKTSSCLKVRPGKATCKALKTFKAALTADLKRLNELTNDANSIRVSGSYAKFKAARSKTIKILQKIAKSKLENIGKAKDLIKQLSKLLVA